MRERGRADREGAGDWGEWCAIPIPDNGSGHRGKVTRVGLGLIVWGREEA